MENLKSSHSNKNSFTKQEQLEFLSSISAPDNYILLNLIKKYNDLETTLPKLDEEILKIAQSLAKINSNGYFPSDSEIKQFATNYINNEIKRQIKNQGDNANGIFSYVLGTAGAGKSTTINKIVKNYYSFHADADAIKNKIAENFNCDINHYKMHETSKVIINELTNEAVKNGLNIIVEKIGDEPNKIFYRINELKQIAKENFKPFSSHLNIVHIDSELARIRNIDRLFNLLARGDLPRMVEDKKIKEWGENPFFSYMYLAKIPNLFDKCSAISNEVQFGKNAIKLRSLNFENGIADTDKHYENILHYIQNASIIFAGRLLNKLKNELDTKKFDKELNVLVSLVNANTENEKQNIFKNSNMKIIKLINKNIEKILIKIYDPENIEKRENLEIAIKIGRAHV
jgi:signal recognition particle GTPase